jgi:hypothetical protein
MKRTLPIEILMHQSKIQELLPLSFASSAFLRVLCGYFRFFAPLAIFCFAFSSTARGEDFQPIKYRNPGLQVDLGVGLWPVPLPMDYDRDGDLDLLVSTSNKPSGGIYLFENKSGGGGSPVFSPGVRMGDANANISISYPGGEPLVMTPGREFKNFRPMFLTAGADVPFKPKFYIGRGNHWTRVDFDGDQTLDLIIGVGDWREYGWDDAFDSQGRWTHGPLHGYVYVMRNEGSNARPRFGEPMQLLAGGKTLDMFGAPTPQFADWDRDGDLDLVCGEFLDRLMYFENTGSRHKPNYAAGRFLESQHQVIHLDLEMIIPTAFDWDRDGDVDLVVGQEDGRVALLENTGKLADHMPQFKPPVFLRQEADLVKCGALATPYSYDWDGDGDEDIVSGDSAGYIHLVENLDGGNPPRFAAPRYLEAGGKTIRIEAGPNGSIQGPAEAKWGYTVLSVADWNHDSLPDIVLNSIWGAVVWYENEGTRREPKLKAAQPIQVEWPGTAPKPAWNWWSPKGKELVTQWRTSPAVYDYNEDGLNDLVMLDHEGYLAWFERRKDDDALQLLPGKRIFLDKADKPLQLSTGRAGKSGRRKFTLADWDRDGRVDILLNGRNVEFYRNLGENRFENLGPVGTRILAGHDTCPTTVDWDHDKIPDLLVSAEDGFLYYLPNPLSAVGTTRPAP